MHRPPASPSTIAVLATHWLGDTFWALQVVPFLQRAHPTARIDLLVRPGLEWLARLWVSADRVHAVRGLVSDRRREGLPRPWRIVGQAWRLRSEPGRPDLLLDLTATPASALFAWALRPAYALGAGRRSITSRPYDGWRSLRGFEGHLAMRPWWVLEPVYASHEAWPPRSELRQPRLPAWGRARPVDRKVLFFPGAGWPQKRWSLEGFTELARRLERDGWQVMLLFARGEETLAAEAASALVGLTPGVPRRRVQVTDGEQLLELLRNAQAVVANDSGPAHLAAALGLPTVALFGPTNPEICGPLGENVRVLRTECHQRPEGRRHHCHDRPAYPCDRHCLDAVSVDAVCAALEALP